MSLDYASAFNRVSHDFFERYGLNENTITLIKFMYERLFHDVKKWA